MKRRSLLTAILLCWVLVGVVYAATIVSDTFTDTSGIDLNSHTGETGATWTRSSAFSGNAMLINANGDGIRPDTLSAVVYYYASGIPSTAEYDVNFTIRYTSGDISEQSMIICGRGVTNDFTGWCMSYNGFAGAWGLEEHITDGNATVHDDFIQTLSTSTNYNARLEIRNSSMRGYVDDVLRLEYLGSQTITAAGRVAVANFTILDNRPNGLHLMSINVTDPPGGGATQPTLLLLGVGLENDPQN